MNTSTVVQQSESGLMARVATLLAIAAAIPPQPTATPVGTCPGPISANGLPPQLQLEFAARCVERIRP